MKNLNDLVKKALTNVESLTTKEKEILGENEREDVEVLINGFWGTYAVIEYGDGSCYGIFEKDEDADDKNYIDPIDAYSEYPEVTFTIDE